MSKEFRNKLKESLLKEREKLSASSLQTYVSLLANLSQRLEGINTVGKFIEAKEQILKSVSEMKSVQTQKTVLSALFILTNDNDYREKMMVHIKTTNEKYKSQKVNEKLKDSYLSKAQVKDVFDKLAKQFSNVPSIENYVNYLIVGLMSGLFIAPRRLEYAQVKIKNFNKSQDNFLDAKKLTISFNKYKTSKNYGLQMIEIPNEIKKVMKKFLKLNETDYLFIKKNGKPFAATELSKRIGVIFGDSKIGVDVLRSMYISEVYKNVPELNKLEQTAKEMSHSVNSAMTYYKKNDI